MKNYEGYSLVKDSAISKGNKYILVDNEGKRMFPDFLLKRANGQRLKNRSRIKLKIDEDKESIETLENFERYLNQFCKIKIIDKNNKIICKFDNKCGKESNISDSLIIVQFAHILFNEEEYICVFQLSDL